jgi:hypothetical protein
VILDGGFTERLRELTRKTFNVSGVATPHHRKRWQAEFSLARIRKLESKERPLIRAEHVTEKRKRRAIWL